MSRRRKAVKRKILPDPKFKNCVVAKFINCLMYNGKKTVAENKFYEALEVVEDKLKKDALEVFLEAIENVKPEIEVRSRRVGGATYQIPTEVRAERKLALAIRWIINASRKRGEKVISMALAAEIKDAYENKGAAIKKKEETRKMAEANKAFSHFRLA